MLNKSVVIEIKTMNVPLKAEIRSVAKLESQEAIEIDGRELNFPYYYSILRLLALDFNTKSKPISEVGTLNICY